MKKLKPTSPGSRDTQLVTYRGVLSRSKPHKQLTKGIRRTGGRNNQGRITTRHMGGGNKRRYRMVDFLYNKKDISAKVESIEYDANRTAFVSCILYADGERRYIITPQKVAVGDKIITKEEAPIEPGNRMILNNIPVGTYVYNVELKPNGGAKLSRSAGSHIQVSAHDEGKTSLKMPSGEIRKVMSTCWASIGEVSNHEHKLSRKGKAGRSRWLGIRPTVRGSAMNPVDHPHGGGEGRQGIALRRGPKTRQGKLAYGVKTRTPKKYSNNSIVSRRKTKR